MPPTIHATKNRRSSGILAAIPAEDLKMPLPIVEPTSTDTALNSPSFRGSSIQVASLAPFAHSSNARGTVKPAALQMVCELPPPAFGGSPPHGGENKALTLHALISPREGETRAERARGSLTHHLELQLSNTSPRRRE